MVAVLCHLLLDSSIINSQISPLYRNYSTQANTLRLKTESNALSFKLDSIERIINNMSKVQSSFDGSIQLIFHVIFNGNREYISSASIRNQIDSLNHFFLNEFHSNTSFHYSLLNEYDDLSTKANIMFCLADGAELSGIEPINYRESSVAEWEIDDKIKFHIKGGLDVYEPEYYLNIWICDLSNSSGYTQIPGGDLLTDGIVIDFKFFDLGKGQARHKYNQGKTLAHLIGSYLGLHELWNETIQCGDDLVKDTPIHNAPNRNVGKLFGNTSMCNNTLEMTMNYMDNTPDSVQYMFTNDQVLRMHKFLSPGGPRHTLIDNTITCFSQNKPISIQQNSFEDDQELTIFPNPTNNDITVLLNSKNSISEIQIYNLKGDLITQKQYNKKDSVTSEIISTKELFPGMYLIKITDSNNQLLVSRFSKF